MHKVPNEELNERMKRFRKEMEENDKNWQIAYIFTKVGMYYFTGTMQDGVLIIPRNEEAVLWVRVSYERAVDESNFSNIKPMRSYRDAASTFTIIPTVAYVEKEFLPIAIWERFTKYFPTQIILPVGGVMNKLRAVKSLYELEQMRESGKNHEYLLEKVVPEILHEGISEADFCGLLYNEMIKAGHHGLARFAMYDTNTILGHVAFGESAIYPTHFDGPGGNYGLCPAVPFLGSRDRKLKKGDIVFLDVAMGVNGYHTDSTLTYAFGGGIPDEVMKQHLQCVEIQQMVAQRLKPGNIPEEIYNEIVNSLPADFISNFMGYGSRQSKFLAHSIGLLVDEMPVIANGFKEPLEEGMTFAVEPKKGIENIGVVGTEDTYIVTPNGGECITGTHKGLMIV